MKKMNAAEVNKISKESQEIIRRDAEKTIDARVFAAAGEGRTKTIIDSQLHKQLYYTMEDGYKQELIDRGFTVTQNIAMQGYEISWENAK